MSSSSSSSNSNSNGPPPDDASIARKNQWLLTLQPQWTTLGYMLFKLHKTGRLLLCPTVKNIYWTQVYAMIQKSIHNEEDFCLFLAQALLGLITSMQQHHDSSEHQLRTVAICLEILQDVPKLTKEQVLQLWMTLVHLKSHHPLSSTSQSESSSSSSSSSSTTSAVQSPLMGMDTQSVSMTVSAPTPVLSSSSSSLLSILNA